VCEVDGEREGVAAVVLVLGLGLGLAGQPVGRTGAVVALQQYRRPLTRAGESDEAAELPFRQCRPEPVDRRRRVGKLGGEVLALQPVDGRRDPTVVGECRPTAAGEGGEVADGTPRQP
jgi:hypothetical protein